MSLYYLEIILNTFVLPWTRDQFSTVPLIIPKNTGKKKNKKHNSTIKVTIPKEKIYTNYHKNVKRKENVLFYIALKLIIHNSFVLPWNRDQFSILPLIIQIKKKGKNEKHNSTIKAPIPEAKTTFLENINNLSHIKMKKNKTKTKFEEKKKKLSIQGSDLFKSTSCCCKAYNPQA